MAFSSGRSDPRDLLSKPSVSFLVFWFPAIAIVATGNPHFSAAVRTIMWPAALITMGTACTVNASRCGRLHCYLTGPFFFLMAAISLLYGMGVLHLGGNGWNLIGLALLVGTVAFCCVPELLFGKYWLRGD